MQRSRGKQQNWKDYRSLQENWRYQGNTSCKMGMINDRNEKDITEPKEIKKRWQEYTEPYKKGLNDLDNHNGVVTHLEQDILECEVQWALESIIINKASGSDRIPAEYFKS